PFGWSPFGSSPFGGSPVGSCAVGSRGFFVAPVADVGVDPGAAGTAVGPVVPQVEGVRVVLTGGEVLVARTPRIERDLAALQVALAPVVARQRLDVRLAQQGLEA